MRATRRAFFSLLAACGVGDRQGGGCPTGEQCSDKTPSGLSFLGAALGESRLGRGEPLPLALGGTQRVRALLPSGTSLTLPFEAKSSDAQLRVVGMSGSDVTVKGISEGTAFLRLVEPGSELLYDRVAVSVARIASSDLKPLVYLDPLADRAYARAPGKWVLLAGGAEACVARLLDGAGNRLVDEGMTMATGAGLTAGTRTSWDTLGIRATAAGAGEVTVTTSDGVNRSGTITVVDRVDDILSVAADGAAESTGTPGAGGQAGTVYCFRAVQGTDLVAGAAFTFMSDGSFTVGGSTSPNCTKVTSSGPTAGVLTVRVGTTTRDFLITLL